MDIPREFEQLAERINKFSDGAETANETADFLDEVTAQAGSLFANAVRSGLFPYLDASQFPSSVDKEDSPSPSETQKLHGRAAWQLAENVLLQIGLTGLPNQVQDDDPEKKSGVGVTRKVTTLAEARREALRQADAMRTIAEIVRERAELGRTMSHKEIGKAYAKAKHSTKWHVSKPLTPNEANAMYEAGEHWYEWWYGKGPHPLPASMESDPLMEIAKGMSGKFFRERLKAIKDVRHDERTQRALALDKNADATQADYDVRCYSELREDLQDAQKIAVDQGESSALQRELANHLGEIHEQMRARGDSNRPTDPGVDEITPRLYRAALDPLIAYCEQQIAERLEPSRGANDAGNAAIRDTKGVSTVAEPPILSSTQWVILEVLDKQSAPMQQHAIIAAIEELAPDRLDDINTSRGSISKELTGLRENHYAIRPTTNKSGDKITKEGRRVLMLRRKQQAAYDRLREDCA